MIESQSKVQKTRTWS